MIAITTKSSTKVNAFLFIKPFISTHSCSKTIMYISFGGQSARHVKSNKKPNTPEDSCFSPTEDRASAENLTRKKLKNFPASRMNAETCILIEKNLIKCHPLYRGLAVSDPHPPSHRPIRQVIRRTILGVFRRSGVERTLSRPSSIFSYRQLPNAASTCRLSHARHLTDHPTNAPRA